MSGRLSVYSEELADTICERISSGESLNAICKDEGMPNKATVLRWLGREEHSAFRDQYARAREAQADALFDEMLEIADDSAEDVQRSRLKFDARKWMASKLQPKKYGDRQQVQVGYSFEDALDELDKLKADAPAPIPLPSRPLSTAASRWGDD